MGFRSRRLAADYALCAAFGIVAMAYLAGIATGAEWADWPAARDAILFCMVERVLLRLDKAEEAEAAGDLEEEPHEADERVDA